VSVVPAAVASVFRLPEGRTTAPAYRGAEAGITPAGSAEEPGEEEEPQPASAIAAVVSARRGVSAAAARRRGRRLGMKRS
jgi:hypothetical protein